MDLFKNLIYVISFLTILPICKKNFYSLNDVAKSVYLFPAVGIFIGIINGCIGLITGFFLDYVLVSFIITFSIIFITGFHHTEALADLADGLMVKGDIERKKAVLKDPRIGAAGAIILIIYIIGLLITISSYKNYFDIFIPLIISEALAKFAMVLQVYKSKSAWTGLNSPFIDLTNDKTLILSLCIVLPLFIINVYYVLPFLIALVAVVALRYISYANFGGISGDVIGTTNELVRLLALILMSPLILFNR